MKDLSLSAAQISEVLEKFLTATMLELTFRISLQPGQVPDLLIEFAGPDIFWLTSSESELLKALEILSGAIRAPERPELSSCKVVSEVIS